jgi:hypothetical protein
MIAKAKRRPTAVGNHVVFLIVSIISTGTCFQNIPAAHQETDGHFVDICGTNDTLYPPLSQHEDAIADKEEFVEVFGYIEDACAVIRLVQKLGVNHPYSGDIQASRRVYSHHELGITFKLPGDDNFLEVAA